MAMKILVTGDQGYIGAVLAPYLLKSGFKIVGLDAGYYNQTLGKTKPPVYAKIAKDIRELTFNDLTKIEAIIHLAALSNDPIGELNPALTEEVNFHATVNLAKLAKRAGVKRFIFSSSCSVYGLAKEETVSEKSTVNPLTAYARSKIASEKALQALADKDFCVVLMRNSTVYGYSPKFRNDLVVNNLVTCGLALGEIKVLSDGSPWRPLIDVRDLARIFKEFLLVDANLVNGKIINIGFAENNLRVKDILDEVSSQLPECKIIYTGEHGADTRSYRVDFSKFHKLFPGLKQQWPIKKSIKDLIKHLRKSNYQKKDFINNHYTRIAILKKLTAEKKVNDQLYWQ